MRKDYRFLSLYPPGGGGIIRPSSLQNCIPPCFCTCRITWPLAAFTTTSSICFLLAFPGRFVAIYDLFSSFLSGVREKERKSSAPSTQYSTPICPWYDLCVGLEGLVAIGSVDERPQTSDSFVLGSDFYGKEFVSRLDSKK